MSLKATATWVSVAVIGFGVLLIVGTRLGWKFLVDPPEGLSPFYTNSWLKKSFGADFLQGFNYLVGVGFIVVGLLGLYIVSTGKVVYGW